MSSTVQFGSMEATSTSTSAKDMVEALKPEQDNQPKAKVLVDKGVPVEEETPKDEVSEAASTLGKKGGKAAAKARKAAEADEPEETEGNRREPKAEPKETEEEPKAAKAEEDEDESTADLDPKGRAASRIQNLARAKRELSERLDSERRERESLARQVAELRAKVEPPKPGDKPAQASPAEDPEPKVEDFEVYEEYVKAAGKHSARQEFRRLEQEAAQRHEEAKEDNAAVTLMGHYRQNMAKAVSEDPEVMERIHPSLLNLSPSFLVPPDRRVGPHNIMADEILLSQIPHKLLEHFTEHPEDYRRIAASGSPRVIAREFARLEDRLGDATSGTPQPKREVSKAPNPVRPVTGSPHTDSGIPDEHAPLSAFVRDFGQRQLRNSR